MLRGRGNGGRSRCAWTLFDRLSSDLHYWTCGLPALNDVGDTHIKDSGVWGQPFLYSSLAHIVVPRHFGFAPFSMAEKMMWEMAAFAARHLRVLTVDISWAQGKK